MWHRSDVEPIDACEVVWVAGVQRQAVRDRRRRDQGVEGPRGGLAAGPSERCRHPSEGTGSVGIERDGFEISLGLLNVRRPASLLWRVIRDERSNGQLRKCDSGDPRDVRQRARIDARQEEEGTRVEQAFRLGHRR